MTRSWGWSAILYTIDFEYKGGTYLAQVEAFDPEEVLDLWTKQISDEELVRWKVDRSALIDALASETLIPVEGLVGVWCASSAIGGSFALANIVATDTTAPNARLDLTSNELDIVQNALNEICNGIALQCEFETRIGSSIEAARALLHRISTSRGK
jgi:hypothetical protein